MALHLQQQILEAVQAVLIAGDTDAGQDVFVDRLDPLPKGKRFAILVREGDGGDDVQPATIRDLQERTLDVEVTCALRSCDDAAAQARAFGLAVEKLLNANPRPAALVALCRGGWVLTNSRLAHSGEGEEAVAARLQFWRFTYYVRKATPDVVA